MRNNVLSLTNTCKFLGCWTLATLCTVLLGCSQPKPLPAPPLPVREFDLEMSATATRNAQGTVLVNFEDTSAQGLEVLHVENVNLDECLGADGNQIPAKLRTFGWKIGEGKDSTECFQLLLVMTGRIPDAIGQLDGTFVVAHGEKEDVSVNVENAAQKLADFSVQMKTDRRTTLQLELTGENLNSVGKIALESDGKLLEGGSSSFSSGRMLRGLSRRWNVSGTPRGDEVIRFWKGDSDSSEPLSSMPFNDKWSGNIDGLEGVTGEMRAIESMTVRFFAPKTALLSIKPELNNQPYDAKLRREPVGDNQEVTLVLGPEWRDIQLVVVASKNAKLTTCSFSASNLQIE